MIEPTVSSVNTETHFFECLPVSLALPVVMLFDGFASLLDALGLKEFDGVVLRRVTHTPHAKTGVIGHGLNVGFAGNHPPNTNAW